MNKIPIWMDCDTGTDDAVAIMTAHALEELEIIGLSTVCGNAPQEFTYTNTLRMNRLMGDRGYSFEKCLEIMGQQMPEDAYAALSDLVIDNGRDMAFVEAVWIWAISSWILP